MWRVREFKRSILNLWRFRKVVWNFRPYEYEFTVELLHQGLIEQGKYIREHGNDCDKDALASIAVAVHFCSKISNGHIEEKDSYCDKLGQIISKEMKNWWL